MSSPFQIKVVVFCPVTSAGNLCYIVVLIIVLFAVKAVLSV